MTVFLLSLNIINARTVTLFFINNIMILYCILKNYDSNILMICSILVLCSFSTESFIYPTWKWNIFLFWLDSISFFCRVSQLKPILMLINQFFWCNRTLKTSILEMMEVHIFIHISIFYQNLECNQDKLNQFWLKMKLF